MDDSLHRIINSKDPADLMEDVVEEGSVLRSLNQHIFYSLFSSYVADRPKAWTAQAAEAALQLLSEEKGNRYSRDWLLEIAFHGNLALVGTDDFYGSITRIEAALHSLEHDGISRSSQYVKGLLAYARDDLVAAERAFSTLAGLMDSPLLAYQSGYPAFRAPGFRRTLEAYDPKVQLSFIKEPKLPDDASIVLLCAVDDLYFSAFADDFVVNALSVSPAAQIHFHFIDNVVDISRLTQTDILFNDRVSATVERTDRSRSGTHAIMARYIVLPLLLQKWSKPVLVTDVDLTFKCDPSRLAVNDPVTLCSSGNPAAAYMPATAVIGHHNLFQPSEAGIAFSQLLSRYLHYMCSNGQALWAADQVALLIVSRMLGNLMSIGSIRNLQSYSYGAPSDRPRKKKEAEARLEALRR